MIVKNSSHLSLSVIAGCDDEIIRMTRTCLHEFLFGPSGNSNDGFYNNGVLVMQGSTVSLY